MVLEYERRDGHAELDGHLHHAHPLPPRPEGACPARAVHAGALSPVGCIGAGHQREHAAVQKPAAAVVRVLVALVRPSPPAHRPCARADAGGAAGRS